MKIYRNIQLKISLIVLTVLLGAGIVFSVFFMVTAEKRSMVIARDYLQSIPNVVDMAVTHFLDTGERTEMHKIISQMVNDNNIDSIFLFDFAGDEICVDEHNLAHQEKILRDAISKRFQGFEKIEKIDFKGKELLTYYRPLDMDKSCRSCHEAVPVGGFININLDLTTLNKTVRKNLIMVVSVVLGSGIFLFLILVLVLRKIITAPVNRLLESLNSVIEDNLDTELKIDSRDEFETIAKLFNRMVASQRKAFETVSRMHSSAYYKDRMATVGTLTSSISHEIKNPLNSIMLNAELIKMKKEKADEYADRIMQNADRIKEIIDSTLRFSGYSNFSGQCIDVLKYVSSLEFYLKRTIFSDKRVSFTVLIEDGIKCIFLDEPRLDQLVMNLIKNAYESIPDDNTGAVELIFSQLEEYTCISVSDTGIGILAEQKDQIFNEFHTTKEGSAGIGLNIIEDILQQVDGKLEYESSPSGSVFKAYVPVNDEKCTIEDSGADCTECYKEKE